MPDLYEVLTGDEPCRADPDVWFSDDPANVRKALSGCLDCPVVDACRDWGMEHERYGTWGGMTALDRANVRAGRGTIAKGPVARHSNGSTVRYNCGTAAAYKWHRRNGEEPDAACLEASRTDANSRYAARTANRKAAS